MKRVMHILLKIAGIVLKGIGILIGLLLVLEIVIIPLGNEWILQKYSRKLETYDFGIDYDIVASDSQCGKLYGNGNGMEYFSVELIYCEEAISLTENEDWGEVCVKKADYDFMEEMNGSYDFSEVTEAVRQLKETKNYYIVYVSHSAQAGSIWESDLRAH